MSTEKIFKTKTGFCHILPEKIILTRDGIIGKVAETTVGKSITKILIIYSILSIVLFFYAFVKYKDEKFGMAGFLIFLALYLAFGILSSLNNSATPVILKDSIQKVVFKNGIKGLTRARFEIFFYDTTGKLKKRLVLLPGSLSGGKTTTEKAVKIMKEEGLIL